MKKQYLHIPEPCHENWDAMSPAQQGRFCGSCSKEVVDFSSMTDRQILDVLSKAAGNTCGRFTESQLERPIEPEVSFFLKPYKIILSSLVPALLIAGNTAAQSKPVNKPMSSAVYLSQVSGVQGEVALVVRGTDTVRGRITDENGHPVASAAVHVKDAQVNTLSNKNGHFSLPCAATTTPVKIQVSHTGYETKEVSVISGQETLHDIQLRSEEVVMMGMFLNTPKRKQTKPASVKTEKKTIVKGKVVNASGEPLPFATVCIKDHVNAAADSTGKFSIALDGSKRHRELVASHVGYHENSTRIDLRKDSPITLVLDGNNMLKEATVTGYGLNALTAVAGGLSIVQTVTPIDTARTFVQKLFNNDLFKAFPNPVIRGHSVQLSFRKGGEYSIQLFDNAGKLYAAKQLRLDGTGLVEQFSIPPGIGAGIYYISATNLPANKRFVDKIIVQ